jgi:hypothetical protein
MLEFSCRVSSEVFMLFSSQASHSVDPLYSQTSISSGKILRMGKGFTIDGVQGQDLSALFNEAFSRKVCTCFFFVETVK